MTHSDVIHAALQGAVDDGTFPGAVLAVRLRGRLVYEAAVGRLFVQPLGEPVTTETWYDLASLTKVLATTTALLLLVQRGEVALGDPIQKILPELVGRPCGSATIRQLLTHSSGLPAGAPISNGSQRQKARTLGSSEPLRHGKLCSGTSGLKSLSTSRRHAACIATSGSSCWGWRWSG